MPKKSPRNLFSSTIKSVLLAGLLAGGCASIAHAAPEPIAPDWDTIRYKNHTLNFDGYFRTTYGGDASGENVMPMFQAPGADSKFRLGNESDTNIEVALDYNYYLDGAGVEGSRFIQALGLIADYEVNPNYDEVKIEFLESTLSQAFLRFGNFLGDGVHAWFGRRYYDRRDIHINDHFWLNVAQGSEIGGGVEGIPLGIGRLDLAVFKNEDDEVSDLSGTTNNAENLDSFSYDARYRGIPTVENGDLTLWGLYSRRPENRSINYNEEDGFGIGGWHTLREVMEGRMVTGFAYRTGTAIQQGLFNSKPVREDQGYDLDEAFTVELNNDYLYENDDYAVQWATVLKHEDRGTTGGDEINWVQTGVRPVFFLNDYVSIAPEVGVDYVDNDLIGQEGFLGKGTLALQLTRGKGFWQRPVVRVFATGAKWSDDFKGSIGASPPESTSYVDDTAGLSFGVQFETWW